MAIREVPFYKHQLGTVEKDEILKSLDSPILTTGPINRRVEQELQDYFKVDHVKLVNSWTNGALAALLTLGVGPGDEVIVPSMTFVACANIVEILGATPIFCDVSSEDLLVSLDEILQVVTPRTKAVMLVHLYGQMCDVESISREMHKLGISVIEDCAHSFESTRDGRRPGFFSDFAIFSFYATKNITCGEGGAVITNRSELYRDLVQRVSHGMSASAVDRFKTGTYSHWDVKVLGVKANLPDVLAALLPSQLTQVESKLELRRILVERYDHFVERYGIRIPRRNANSVHAHHLYPIWIPDGKRDLALELISMNKIGVTVNFRSVNSLNYYRSRYPEQQFATPISTEWGSGVLSLPLYPGLTEEEQGFVIDILESKIIGHL
jgi:UDP-4-amino-4-deoxy-L-arabinose-oxoglutarate aminotransferase